MIKFLCIFFVFGYLFAAEDGISDKKRNQHSPCYVVLNEFSPFSTPVFVEISKLCKPGEYNNKPGMSGFYLLILDGEALRIEFLKNLGGKRLHFKNVDPLQDETQKLKGQGKYSRPRARRPDQPEQGSSSRDFNQKDRCERTFQGCSEPSNTGRKRRHADNSQPHVRGISVVELPEFRLDADKTYGVMLIWLSYERKRRGTTDYKAGSTLTQDQEKEIRKNLHDLLLITPTEGQQDTSALLRVIPENVPAIFLDFPSGQQHSSLSKCDKSITPVNANGFIHAPPSKGERNNCKSFKESQPFKFKGKVLRAQTREVVVNVVTNLNKRIDDPSWRDLRVVDAASKLLNLSPNTIYKILSEYAEGKPFKEGGKRNRRCSVTDISNEMKKDLYETITSYYRTNRTPYFRDIFKDWLAKVRSRNEPSEEEDENPGNIYTCGAGSFAKILKRNGYRYGKIRHRDALIFRPVNIQLRAEYLRRIKEYDEDPTLRVIYQDETWIDVHARSDRGWQLKRFTNFLQRREFAFENTKISRGARLIVLAAGGKDGFVSAASEVFAVATKRKKKSKRGDNAAEDSACGPAQDYHENVTGDRFFVWMEKLLDALGDTKTVIVLDNCSIHKVRTSPSMSAKKTEMTQWLQKYKREGMQIPEDVSDDTRLTKKQLLEIIQRVVREKKLAPTKLQDLIERKGHKMLLLPPYSPDLNPIEEVWADVKRAVKDKNSEQTVSKAKDLTESELMTYPVSKWQAHVRHVKRTEEEYREGDKVFLTSASSGFEVGTVEDMTATEFAEIDAYAGVQEDDDSDDSEECD